MKIRNCKKCNHVFNSDKFDKCPKCQTPWKSGKSGNTMILRREEVAAEPKSKKKEKATPFLVCEESPDNKIMITKPEFIIGRSREADLFFNDTRISRQHAKILPGDEECYLVDLKSDNGTFINGIRIEADKKNKLKSGDLVIFYTHKCIFYEE